MKTQLALSCLIGLAVGCGGSTQTVFPVSGKVLVNGQPAVGATVFLHPLGDQAESPLRPTATVAADGTFKVTTYRPGDGAPPGEYAVTLVWPAVWQEGGETVEGRDRLLDGYRDPKKPALRVTVKEGDNNLPPLELQVQ